MAANPQNQTNKQSKTHLKRKKKTIQTFTEKLKKKKQNQPTIFQYNHADRKLPLENFDLSHFVFEPFDIRVELRRPLRAVFNGRDL
jgi:hypothetical protein